ncbi:hypothetical protein LPB142_15440 [Rhodobacter xanthinilyticus]|uniref:Multidrug resistance protein MdtA-like barrel-sandwich hybrid domain-containing protein n=1 Tax=Rhodobacter xanthinilyticus TaxID=1850250 RepID=A0A1D9MFH8_9RHOB|nr:efflux RND transporter periplasmic adaptor subunit [Rhodobacter xanthinilyticus]AOZ70553.1 hypothetical protein LPB142_15440 [Rhodobacter xanthinilyticus]
MRDRVGMIAAAGLWALGGAAAAEEPLAVRVVPAQPVTAELRLELTGEVEAAEAVPLGFRSGGQILEIAVEVGETVAVGQLLGRVDPAQARAALAAAQAQRRAAEATLTQARQARERTEGLTARGAMTQAALDAALEAELSAQSTDDQARAAQAKAAQALRDTELRAPVAGVVTARSAEAGQVVGAAQPVITLARAGRRIAVFQVPDAPQISAFAGREIALRSLDGAERQVRAVVSEISPVVSAQTGTVRIKAALAEGPEAPGLGAAVAGRLDLPLGAAVSVPWSALAVEGGRAAVWVVDPGAGRARLTPVEVLRYTDERVELSGGLAAGTLVAAEGAHLLYPGRPVTAVEGVR